MMNMHKLLKSKKHGFTMILAMFVVAMLLILGTGLLTLGLNSRTFSIRTSSQFAARSAADAGMTKAFYEMSEKLKVKPWDGNSLPLAVNQALPNCSEMFNYTVTGNLIDGYTIESIGKSGNAERSVQCTLELQGPFEYAIFGDEGIELKDSAALDWYNFGDSDGNMEVGTNSIVSGAIILKSSATINGDVVVGLGGNPDDVIDLQDSSVITGQTSAAIMKRKLPSVIVPQWLQELTSGGTIKKDIVISTSGKFDEIGLKNEEIMEIVGNVTLYITGDVILNNSAVIKIGDANDAFNDASLILYVGGKIEGKNTSAFNNETHDPKKLKIFGLDSCTDMKFKNNAEFYGVIYAPKAYVTFNNSAAAYGSIIVKSFVQDNSASFYFDASLIESMEEDDQAVLFEITKWHEN